MKTMKKNYKFLHNDSFVKNRIKEYWKNEYVQNTHFEISGLFFEYPTWDDVETKARIYESVSKIDLCFDQSTDQNMINSKGAVLRYVSNFKNKISDISEISLFDGIFIKIPNDCSWLIRQLKKLASIPTSNEIKAKALKYLLVIQERNLNALYDNVDELIHIDNPSPVWTTGWNSKYAGDHIAGHICYQLGFSMSKGNMRSISSNLEYYLQGKFGNWEWESYTDNDGIDHGGYYIVQ